jgi:hypothetical protein
MGDPGRHRRCYPVGLPGWRCASPYAGIATTQLTNAGTPSAAGTIVLGDETRAGRGALGAFAVIDFAGRCIKPASRPTSPDPNKASRRARTQHGRRRGRRPADQEHYPSQREEKAWLVGDEAGVDPDSRQQRPRLGCSRVKPGKQVLAADDRPMAVASPADAVFCPLCPSGRISSPDGVRRPANSEPGSLGLSLPVALSGGTISVRRTRAVSWVWKSATPGTGPESGGG